MKTSVLCTALLVLTLALPAVGAGPADLLRLSLDRIEDLGTRIEHDSSVRKEGDGSVRIATRWPTTVNLAIAGGLEVEHAKLVFEADLRSDNLDGTAYLEMWCEVDGGRYFARGLDTAVTGTTDWTTSKAPFFLDRGQKAGKAVLNIVVNGTGTVWIDNLRLYTEVDE